MKIKEYRIGDVALAAVFIVNGVNVIRIDRIFDKYNKIRVLFVFDATKAAPVEADYLSYNCNVDARKYTDTINNLREIIKNTNISVSG